MTIDEFIDLIPYGRENAISRCDLTNTTGFSDRQVRMFIQAAREEGYPIMSSCSTNGYWLTDDKQEINEFKSEQNLKALGIYNMSLKMGSRTVKQ